MTQQTFYNISEMVDLTGATEFLLRSWELRYNVVRPKRTPTGRRLYTESDVLKISKIVQLSNQGLRIGQLAPLSLQQLEALDAKNLAAPPKNLAVITPQKSNSIQNVFNALAKTEWLSMSTLFAAQRSKLSAADFIHSFIIPIAQEMSRRSLSDGIDIIQEHLLTSLIKESLYSLNVKTSARKRKNRFKIIFATLEGDHHDLGLLLSKVIAQIHGHECIFLGGHVPKKELCEASVRLKPSHIVIATTANHQQVYKDDLLKYLNFVDRHAPQKMALWVGGSGAEGLTLHLERPFQVFANLADYEDQLRPKKKE